MVATVATVLLQRLHQQVVVVVDTALQVEVDPVMVQVVDQVVVVVREKLIHLHLPVVLHPHLVKATQVEPVVALQ